MSDELLAAIDVACGYESRASFVRRTLSAAVDGQKITGAVSVTSTNLPAYLATPPPDAMVGTVEAVQGDTATIRLAEPRKVTEQDLAKLDADLSAMTGDAGFAEAVRPALAAAYRCPVTRCEFSSSSPAAICAKHGRKVKPPKGGKG